MDNRSRPPMIPLTEAELAALPAIGGAAPDDAGRIAKAKAIVAACRAITGTFADAYLGSRCVDISALPKGVAGWHEESRALVFPACDERGGISACQRLFFNADGVPVVENSGKKKRRTNGVLRGSALSVPGEGDVLVCEGAEDGLSLWCATRQPVRVAFGVSNLGRVPLPDGAATVIVVDNDNPGMARKKRRNSLPNVGMASGSPPRQMASRMRMSCSSSRARKLFAIWLKRRRFGGRRRVESIRKSRGWRSSVMLIMNRPERKQRPS